MTEPNPIHHHHHHHHHHHNTIMSETRAEAAPPPPSSEEDPNQVGPNELPCSDPDPDPLPNLNLNHSLLDDVAMATATATAEAVAVAAATTVQATTPETAMLLLETAANAAKSENATSGGDGSTTNNHHHHHNHNNNNNNNNHGNNHSNNHNHNMIPMAQATETAMAQAVLQEAMASMETDHDHHQSLLPVPQHYHQAPYPPSSGAPGVDISPSRTMQGTGTSTGTGTKRPLPDLQLQQHPPPPPPAKRRVAPTRVPWDERVKQLQAYKDVHGDLLIPIRYKVNPSLGKFVHNTREQYKLYHKVTPQGYKKKCSLTADRIRQLDDLGFPWTTRRSEQQHDHWRARLNQLQAFKDKHGHCLVPHGYPEDPSFAEWIHRQRTAYHSLRKQQSSGGTTANNNNDNPNASASASPSPSPNPHLSSRMDQLQAIGFNFTVHSDKWMDHCNQLLAYKNQHGDCQVPTHYAENPKLGRWVHTQRHQRRLQLKGKKSCMTPERIDLLDQAGFSWEVRPSLERPRATWQQRLEELTVFHKECGHFLMYPTAMPQLYAWCHEQRQRLRWLDKQQQQQQHGKPHQTSTAATSTTGNTNGGGSATATDNASTATSSSLNTHENSKRMSPDRVAALQEIGFTKDTVLLESKAMTMPSTVTPNPPTNPDQEDSANGTTTAITLPGEDHPWTINGDGGQQTQHQTQKLHQEDDFKPIELDTTQATAHHRHQSGKDGSGEPHSAMANAVSNNTAVTI